MHTVYKPSNVTLRTSKPMDHILRGAKTSKCGNKKWVTSMCVPP